MVAATFGSAFAYIHYGIGTALTIDVSTFVFAALWLLAHATTLPTEFLALAMLGTFDGTTEVVFDTLSQRATPQRLQASVFALAGAFQNVAMTAGLLAAPLVVTYTQPSTAVTIGGAGCAIAAIAAAIAHRSAYAVVGQLLGPVAAEAVIQFES